MPKFKFLMPISFLFFFNWVNANANQKVACHTNDGHQRNYAKQSVHFDIDSNQIPENIEIFRTKNGVRENSTLIGVFEPNVNSNQSHLSRFNVTGEQTGELMKARYYLLIPKKSLLMNSSFQATLQIFFEDPLAGWLSLNLDCQF